MGKYDRGYSSMKIAVSEGEKGETERPIDLQQQERQSGSEDQSDHTEEWKTPEKVNFNFVGGKGSCSCKSRSSAEPCL